MGMQLSTSGVINQIVNQGLFQGADLNSVVSSSLSTRTSSTENGQTGDPFLDAQNNFISMCDIDVCEETSLAGK